MSKPVKIAEDLQPMYDFSQKHLIDANWNNLAVCNLIERVSAAEAALALEREENARLLEWKTAVSSAVKSIPQFSSGTWCGDKEGWGFHFEIVHWLRRSYAALEAELERLKAPVSDEEWYGVGVRSNICSERAKFDAIIAARSKAPDGAQEAEGAR